MNFEMITLCCGSVSNGLDGDNGILSGARGSRLEARRGVGPITIRSSHLGHCTNCAHAVSIIGYFSLRQQQQPIRMWSLVTVIIIVWNHKRY